MDKQILYIQGKPVGIVERLEVQARPSSNIYPLNAKSRQMPAGRFGGTLRLERIEFFSPKTKDNRLDLDQVRSQKHRKTFPKK